LAGVSGEYVIVLVAEYAESEVGGVRNIDNIMMAEKSVRGSGPVGFRTS